MKHTNFSFILVLFFSLQQILCAEEQQQVVAVSEQSTQRFVEYLGNVAAVLSNDEDLEAEQIAYIRHHLAKTTTLLTKINDLFARGAFARCPTLKTKFYNIFNAVDTSAWPTRAAVRLLKNDITDYKKYLIRASLFATDLDREAINAISMLQGELERFVLIDDFFCFSLLDGIIDTFVVRPIEFAKAHPYIAIGAVVCVVAIGGVTYWYVTKKSDLEKYLEENNIQLVLGSQNAADCGVKALYAAWCTQEAKGDLEEYKNLFCDNARYDRFKKVTAKLLQDGVASGRIIDKPRDAKNPTNWLENGHISYLRERFNEAAEDGHEFGFGYDTMHFVRSREEIDEEAVDAYDVVYIDQQLRARDGDLKRYGDDVPADRIEHCIEERRPAGLRHEMQQAIGQFNKKEGNQFGFIINEQRITAAQKELISQAMKQGKKYNPAVRGHFFHVNAINDSKAEDGIRFVVTDTFEPDIDVLDDVLPNLRHLLGQGGE